MHKDFPDYPDVFLPKDFKPNAPLDNNPYAEEYFTHIASDFPEDINDVKTINSISQSATKIRDEMIGKCAPSGENEFANDVLYGSDRFSYHETITSAIDEIAYACGVKASEEQVYQWASEYQRPLKTIVKRYERMYKKNTFYDFDMSFPYTNEYDRMEIKLKTKCIDLFRPLPEFSNVPEEKYESILRKLNYEPYLGTL